MNGKEEVVVRSPPNGVCNQNEFPREGVRVPQVDRDGELQHDHERHNVFCHGCVAHELGDLRGRVSKGRSGMMYTHLGVRLHDRSPPRTMGLLGHQPQEVGGVHRRRRVRDSIVLLGGGNDHRPSW